MNGDPLGIFDPEFDVPLLRAAIRSYLRWRDPRDLSYVLGVLGDMSKVTNAAVMRGFRAVGRTDDGAPYTLGLSLDRSIALDLAEKKGSWGTDGEVVETMLLVLDIDGEARAVEYDDLALLSNENKPRTDAEVAAARQSALSKLSYAERLALGLKE